MSQEEDSVASATESEDRRALLDAIVARRKARPSPESTPLSREDRLRLSHEAVLRQHIAWGEKRAELRRNPEFRRLMASEDWERLENLRLEALSARHVAMTPFRDRLYEELSDEERADAARRGAPFDQEIADVETEMARQLRSCLSPDDQRVITLEDIREALAAGSEQADPHGEAVLYLGDTAEQPIVLGVRQARSLTEPQRNVLMALLKAGPIGLSKDQLDIESGHPEARKILSRLARSSEQWSDVIQLPGDARNGYRLRDDCFPPT